MRILLGLGLVAALGLVTWFVLGDSLQRDPIEGFPTESSPVSSASSKPTDSSIRNTEPQRHSVPVSPRNTMPEPRRPRGGDPAKIARDGTVNARVQGWVKDILQNADPSLRQAALDELRGALARGNDTQAMAALLALNRVGHMRFDRSGDRELVLPFLDSEDDELRIAALGALFHTTPVASDLDRVCALVDDPSSGVRAAVGTNLFLYRKGDFREGPASEAIQRLLTDPAEHVVERTIVGLRGAQISIGIEEQLVRLLEESPYPPIAVHGTLAEIDNKSERVIDVLARALNDPKGSISRQARWGLGRGVPEESRARVAHLYLDQLRVQSDSTVQRECLQYLALYATTEHVPALRQIVEVPTLEESTRHRARQLLERLEKRQ